ncbi:hypothetical protein Tco_0588952 [Tanacetum coccineum]
MEFGRYGVSREIDTTYQRHKYAVSSLMDMAYRMSEQYMSLTTSPSSDSSYELRKGDTSGVSTDSASETMSPISRYLGGAYGPNGFTFSIVNCEPVESYKGFFKSAIVTPSQYVVRSSLDDPNGVKGNL